jgi:hypothetical protein
MLMENRSRHCLRALFWIAGLAILFALYTSGLRRNPPGFYVDESALAYNAYLVAHTGAGEFGPRFPIYFQFFADSWAQYVSPTQVYLLSALFVFFPPSILLARIFAAFWIFAACLLLGALARRISGQLKIGIIVTASALVMPWFFEVSRLLLEPHFVPMALVLFLLVVYNAQKKEKWNWRDVIMLAATLALITYCYQGGRLLVVLMAIGLLFFATTRQRLLGIIKTWLVYGITLVPLFVFNWRHPGALTKRLYEVSYIRPGVPLSEVLSHFIKRYLEDQSLTALLMNGDYHPRHHVPGSGGALFFATFILALIGLAIIIARRWHNPWWRFILFGLAASLVPGAISVEPFHGMRLIAYPVFLLLLTVPALEWLLARDKHTSDLVPSPSSEGEEPLSEDGRLFTPRVAEGVLPRAARLLILFSLLALTAAEAYRFQTVFRRAGPGRSFDFDVPYKEAYDAATRQPVRPIYLEDGKWGPAYIHALWYATVEKRPTSQFVHLADGAKPPAGAIVISSADTCQHCETIIHPGVYLVYKAL